MQMETSENVRKLNEMTDRRRQQLSAGRIVGIRPSFCIIMRQRPKERQTETDSDRN